MKPNTAKTTGPICDSRNSDEPKLTRMEDVTQILCVERFGVGEVRNVVRPFIIMRVGERTQAVWLEFRPGKIGEKDLLESMAFSQPFAAQTLAEFHNLEIVDLGFGKLTHRAKMDGLVNHLSDLPPGDAGQVILLTCSVGSGYFYGVWADSRGVAEKFIEQVRKFFAAQVRK